MIKKWINRYKALKHVVLLGDDARFFPHKDVQFFIEHSAQVIIEKGVLTLGYRLPKIKSRPTYDKSVFVLEKNATLQISGDVFIAPGFYFHVRNGGKVVFRGQNWIAHNCTMICSNYMEFGMNASLSWNVTMIDDDGRSFFTVEGSPIKKETCSLILKDNVGIQMNVVIPKGVEIGRNSIVGANTVVRQNIPENCLVYQNPELKIHMTSWYCSWPS